MAFEKAYTRKKKEEIEKEVFPECIQAERKYFNKRKSTLNQRHTLSPIFPGEDLKLRKSSDPISFVKSWLEQSNSASNTSANMENSSSKYKSKAGKKTMSRLPLSDLEINTSERNIKITDNFSSSNSVKIRKRSYGKKDISLKNQENTTPKKMKLRSNKENKTRPESPIMDIIVIDDTQSRIDKDEEALAAILKADRNSNLSETYTSIDKEDSFTADDSNTIPSTLRSNNRVPFFYKGSLCSKKGNKEADKPKEIVLKTFTTESDEYITNIKVTECSNVMKPKNKFKYAQIIQTEAIIEAEPRRNHKDSEDLFLGDVENKVLPNEELDLITEDISPGNVLCERRDRNVVPKRRTQRQVASSDSSEKENKDPNSRRKAKGKGKKKLHYKGNLRKKYFDYKL